INMDSDFDVEDVENDRGFPLLDHQQINDDNFPFNERFVVRASPVHGYGLFTRNVTIRPGQHVAHYGGELIDLDEFWERYPNQQDARYVVAVGGRYYRDAVDDRYSLGRFVNTGDRLNVTLSADPHTHTA